MEDKGKFSIIEEMQLKFNSDGPNMKLIPLLKSFFQSLFQDTMIESNVPAKTDGSLELTISNLIDSFLVYFMVAPVDFEEYSRSFKGINSDFYSNVTHNNDLESQLVCACILKKDVHVNKNSSSIVHFIGTHPCCEGNHYATKLLLTVFSLKVFENKGVYCVSKLDNCIVSKLHDKLPNSNEPPSQRSINDRTNEVSHQKLGKIQIKSDIMINKCQLLYTNIHL